MQKPLITSTISRYWQIDFAKAITVLLMFFTHAIAFMYAGKNPALTFIRNWGDIVTFVAFFFLSGASIYLSISRSEGKYTWGKVLSRILTFLFSYYTLAIIANWQNFTSGNINILEKLVKIFVLIDIPYYTEFLIAFILFTILTKIFYKQLLALLKRPLLLLGLGITLYLVGEALFRLNPIGGSASEIGALIYGNSQILRYPILQYALVYILGMLYGRVISDNYETWKEMKSELLVAAIVIFAAGLDIALLGNNEAWRRWPPSIAFMTTGLIWVMMLLLVGTVKINSKPNIISRLFEIIVRFLGKNLLQLFWLQTAMLFLFRELGSTLISRAYLLVGFYLISTTLIILLAAIWKKLSEFVHNSLQLSGHTLATYRLLMALTSIILLLAAALIVAKLKPNVHDPNTGNPPATGAANYLQMPYWYDKYAAGRLAWEVTDKCCQSKLLSTTTVLGFEFDHAALVNKKLSLATGNDLKAVYWDDKAKEYVKLDFKVDAVNTSKATLFANFDTTKILSGNKYTVQLYYGNLHAVTSAFTNITERPRYTYALGQSKSEAPQLTFTTKKKWHLYTDKLEINFKLPDEITESDELVLELFNAKNPGKPALSKVVNWEPGRDYALSYDLSELAYGDYYTRLRINPSTNTLNELASSENNWAVGEKSLTPVTSNFVPFYYSAPVYMSWSIDWEGYDLSEVYWKDITGLSSKYSMPLTHYFNPRIYTNPAISPARAKVLTSWVKGRISSGDEVSLHLHMHYDLVTAAGLTPKTSPAWGGRTEGHDVLTSAYNEAETKQLLEYSIQKFKENGLPKPVGFRAGGWFLDIENLRALDDLGFTYDSSGSDFKDPYGPNKQVRTWNLTPTSRPYQVSSTNQNASTPQPDLKIWEYPNNGADSTNRTADMLINRLHLNVKSSTSHVQEQAQVLVYLSHPHWFNIDKPKMEKLFTEADKYKYSSDSGPLVYVTEINAHNEYQKLIQAGKL
jgi:predicted deacetylase